MTAVYASPRHDGRDLRLCQWAWTYSGATIHCRDRALPGGTLCCEHLVAYVHEPGWSPTLPTTHDLIEARRTA